MMNSRLECDFIFNMWKIQYTWIKKMRQWTAFDKYLMVSPWLGEGEKSLSTQLCFKYKKMYKWNLTFNGKYVLNLF